jgi:8-oxo-dGTP pyrophosphatase MutT (NUDIX family)
VINTDLEYVPQAGAIAFRLTGALDADVAQGAMQESKEGVLEVLLVRPSDGTAKWVFPKGHIKPGELRHETALRELREEAGVTGALVGAVDGISRFKSKDEYVEVRFFVIDAVKFEAPAEVRDHIWLPVALADEALSHLHNRITLSEALPIIESHLWRSGRGDSAFREFLLHELAHATESLFKSEEDGERRARFYLALVAGAGAVLTFMLSDKFQYDTYALVWPLVIVLAGLLLMGIFVLKRLVTRNLQSDEYKAHLRRIRRWFTPSSHDPRRDWVAFDPYAPRGRRVHSYWGPQKGGWVEVLSLVIALLAGTLAAALVPTQSWDIEALVAGAGTLVAWFVLVRATKRSMERKEKAERDDPLPGARSDEEAERRRHTELPPLPSRLKESKKSVAPTRSLHR